MCLQPKNSFCGINNQYTFDDVCKYTVHTGIIDTDKIRDCGEMKTENISEYLKKPKFNTTYLEKA